MLYENGKYNISGGIWQGIRKSFQNGSSLTKLIYINIAVFLLIKLLNVLFILHDYQKNGNELLLNILGLSAYWKNVLIFPWTIITYMFTHVDFLHLLFNILWLYWFGSFFLNYFSKRELAGIYIMGGLSGALVYLLSYNLIPELPKLNTVAIGASASVMAIVFAVCFYLPNHKISLFLIGAVKLKYLAMFTAFIDVISIPSSNGGGHIAHLGGALFGIFFIFAYNRRINLVKPLTLLFGRISRSHRNRPFGRGRTNVSEMSDDEYNMYKKWKNDEMNRVLDKISKSGYESLTAEEKKLLFKYGK